MSHSLSDWSSSAYKRFKKQGIKAFALPVRKTVRGRRKSPKRTIRKVK